jgi:hypothetical protein
MTNTQAQELLRRMQGWLRQDAHAPRLVIYAWDSGDDDTWVLAFTDPTATEPSEQMLCEIVEVVP